MKHGPTTADRFLDSEEGAARERADRDDEGGVRVADIEHGADRRIAQASLAKTRVPLGDRTIFGEATLGHPAADLKTKLERDVPRRTIGTGLPARNYLFHHSGRMQAYRMGRKLSVIL